MPLKVLLLTLLLYSTLQQFTTSSCFEVAHMKLMLDNSTTVHHALLFQKEEPHIEQIVDIFGGFTLDGPYSYVSYNTAISHITRTGFIHEIQTSNSTHMVSLQFTFIVVRKDCTGYAQVQKQDFTPQVLSMTSRTKSQEMFFFTVNDPSFQVATDKTLFSVGFSSWQVELPYMHQDYMPHQQISISKAGYYDNSTIAVIVYSGATFRNRYSRITLVLMIFKDTSLQRAIGLNIKGYHNHNMPISDFKQNYELTPEDFIPQYVAPSECVVMLQDVWLSDMSEAKHSANFLYARNIIQVRANQIVGFYYHLICAVECAPGFQTHILPDGKFQCYQCNEAIPGCSQCSSPTTCLKNCSTQMMSCSFCSGSTQCDFCLSGTPVLGGCSNVTHCSSVSQKSVNGTVHSSSCSSCQTGFALVNGACHCDANPSSSPCSSCHDSNTCASCRGSYYLSSGICNKCKAGCKICVSSSICSSCVEGYYYEKESCQKCQRICQTCKNSTYCTSCSAGYYSSPSTEDGCQPCLEHCPTCTSKTVCTTCITGYYLNQTSCLPCQTGCLACSNSHTCTKCMIGYYKSASKCSVCPSGCYNCANSSYCYSCHEGYFHRQKRCVKCHEGCSLCKKVDTCDFCKVGYFHIGQTCQACDSSCLTCEQFSVCTSCHSGTFLKDNVCYPCVHHCIECSGNSTCQTCSQGYDLTLDKSRCYLVDPLHPHTIDSTKSADDKDNETAILIAVIIVGVVLAVLAVLLVCYWRRIKAIVKPEQNGSPTMQSDLVTRPQGRQRTPPQLREKEAPEVSSFPQAGYDPSPSHHDINKEEELVMEG